MLRINGPICLLIKYDLPTSPDTDAFAPKRRPLKVVPSSKIRVAIFLNKIVNTVIIQNQHSLRFDYGKQYQLFVGSMLQFRNACPRETRWSDANEDARAKIIIIEN